ncbi:M23 family metallopeptidase, partial [Staphylococcus aureus]|uniref:M23 family metallopeptidase n=1 Tax=Staphylococcus aureus TaxID=1280 RepID=UPI0023B08780
HSRNGKPFYTWYCHLDTRTAVTIGASIAKGAPVGEVGTTGNVTGEHVHFNLEVPDYGLRGYVVDWVVDPAPYLPTPAEMSSLPPVPTGEAIDLTRFKEADPYCWRVVRLADGRTEDVQDKQLGSGLFVRRKGNNGEWHQRRADGYYLVHDTSPAPDSQGNERVYTLYKNNVAGAQKSRLSQRIGEGWQENGTHYVQFRAKSDCRNLSENSGNASNSSVITRRETNYTFNRYGQNLTFDEVIWEQTGQETQIYGRKNGKSCGWIGWSAPWGECEPVEIHWDRGILTQEPNRWCGW